MSSRSNMRGLSEYLQYEHSMNKALCRSSIPTSSSNQIAPSSLTLALWLASPSSPELTKRWQAVVKQDAQAQEARMRLCGNGRSACCSRRPPPALIMLTYSLSDTLYRLLTHKHIQMCARVKITCKHAHIHTHTRSWPLSGTLCTWQVQSSLSDPKQYEPLSSSENYRGRVGKRQRASLPRSLASKPNKEPQIAKPLGCLSACRWRPNIIVSTSPFNRTDWGIGQLGSAVS